MTAKSGDGRKISRRSALKVLAVGAGKVGDDGKVQPMAVKPGDKVLFGKYSGQAVKVEGDEVMVMREEDIMAIVEG